MGAEQSGKAYFSLRHLNINLCDLFISPDVPLQSRLHLLSNRAPQLYFLSSCLVNCSFLISKTKWGWFVSLLWFSTGEKMFFPFYFFVFCWVKFCSDLKTQNAAAVISEEQLFSVEPNFLFLSWLPSGENLLYCYTKNLHSLSEIRCLVVDFLSTTRTLCLRVVSVSLFHVLVTLYFSDFNFLTNS